jgi:hypothetical protein
VWWLTLAALQDTTSSTRWPDAFLDDMRQVADPLADSAIAVVFSSGDRAAVQRVLDTLTRNDEIIRADLPPEICDYLDALPVIQTPEIPLIKEGQELFATHGPEILMCLACYSLPAAYAARKGVQVLYRTGYLAQRTNLRLFQTSQMVIDVMTPGGLGPGGRGRVTAEKVRLMHAAIRHLLLTDTTNPWSSELGVPINQEDLAGTLMTFTHLIRDGLEKLGVGKYWPAGYLHAWQAVARMMGIVEAMIPATPDEATELCTIIQRRQVEPSPEGRALTTALLEMMTHYAPPGFKEIPAALMRLFLPPDVADGLGVPDRRLADKIVSLAVDVEKWFIGGDTPAEMRHEHFRKFGTHLVEMLIKAELGGRRPQFRIPTQLQDAWQLSQN